MSKAKVSKKPPSKAGRQNAAARKKAAKAKAVKAANAYANKKKPAAKKAAAKKVASSRQTIAAATGSATVPAGDAGPVHVAGRQPGAAEKSRKPTGGKKSSDGYGLKVQVRTARKRSHSSTLWLARQLNDPYVTKAKREGYRSRAAYKFIEIEERFKLLKPGMVVVDLGTAPGGWAQYASRKVNSIDQSVRGAGQVIGIDLLEVETIPGVEFTVMDFTDEDAPDRLRAMMKGPDGEPVLANAVLSDMAANTTGHKKTDHLRIMYLAELAVEFAREVLAPGGFFLSKVFQGGTEGELLAMLKRDFEVVRHVKPKASRADSAELYVLATGFRSTSGASGKV